MGPKMLRRPSGTSDRPRPARCGARRACSARSPTLPSPPPQDPPAAGRPAPRQSPEHAALARAIGTQQQQELATIDDKIDAAADLDPAVAGGKASDAQSRHAVSASAAGSEPR